MTSMLPTDAITQIAVYTRPAVQSFGLRVFYPPVGIVNNPPELHLFWDETEITHANDRQYWSPLVVKGQIYLHLKGRKAKQVERADKLIVPIVDAFAARDAFKLRRASDGASVDHCMVGRVVPSLVIEYGGSEWYGAEIYWQVKLQRRAGEA